MATLKTLSDTDEGTVSELSASTGKQSTITVTWSKYGLVATLQVTAGPLPATLSITNSDDVLEALLAGNSIKLLLGDDIGTTEAEFDDYVASGEITVTSSDTSVITMDGLVASVVK